VPPQVCKSDCADTGPVERVMRQRVRSIKPRSSGRPDHSRAAAPATCGLAMLVPLNVAYPPPRTDERTP
jgi:hypothetical protein